MPEEHWGIHGGIPSCDLCHARKVKCDRQDPCSRCVTANAQCMRTRQKQKRTPQPRIRTDDKIKALVEKIATLENAVRPAAPQALPAVSAQSTTSNPPSTTADGISPRPSKRSRTGAADSHALLSPSGSVTPRTHRNAGARDHIEKELSFNESLASHQRTVFETAIAFIDQLSQAPPSNLEEEGWSHKVPTDFAKGELLQIILASQQSDQSRPDMQLSFLDHVPPKALERMAFCLLESTADERTLNLCKVVVHFKAALGLYASQLSVPKDPKLREHVKEMQLRHLNAALTALDAVSFLAPPSLLLLQALLTGAVLMYVLGNSTACWSLTAYASRTVIALGYHNTPILTPKTPHDQEIQAAVAWCYHFDRVMSLLLLRPPSLPPLQVPIAQLVEYSPQNPMAIFALVMLELVPIHDKILEMTLAGQVRKMSKEAEPQVNELRRKMDEIYSTMEKARANTPNPTPDYLLHWHSLEFKFFATLTAVHRLSNSVCSCASERSACLDAARRALTCVKSIQHLAKQQDHFLEEYNPYLSWTVLSYPLSPFFVLFCNVVASSNADDFALLQDVVDSISSLVMENRYVERLRRLCNTLLALCRPLVQQSPVESQGLAAATPPSADGQGNWDDDMMAQLFMCQPSLEWFNSEMLDPETWDLNMLS